MTSLAGRPDIVSTADRPDLVPVVADWLWREFWQPKGDAFDAILDRVRATVEAERMPRTLILLVDGVPLGTASLVASDLDTRPELTPWLAGVYVTPEARGQGLVAHLIAAIEAEAHRSGVETLWLFTRTAEPIYQRLGWMTAEHFERNARTYALMRRDLPAVD